MSSDLKSTGQNVKRKFKFDSPVAQVAISPCNSYFVILTQKGKAVVYSTKFNYIFNLNEQD